MAVLKAVIVKAKMTKEGKHKIRIAVYHRHETTYIVTRFVLDSEKEFKDGRVVKRNDASLINSKLRHMIDHYQEKIDEIVTPDIYTCQQIRDIITRKEVDECHTFQSVCKSYTEELRSEGRGSYADLLDYNCTEFTSYTRGDMPLAGITPELIEGYKSHLRKKGTLSESTVNMQLIRTKVIVNKAIKSRLVSYKDHPFVTTTIPSSEPKEQDLSLDSMTKIMSYEPKTLKKRRAKDLFMLSFYLGGANLIDIYNADFNKPEFSYIRTKTRNRVTVKRKVVLAINEQARGIIDKWKNKAGRLDFGFNSYETFRRDICRTIKKMRDELSIEEEMTFYSARKTFSQFASDLGIKDPIIDYCLGHSDKKRGVIRYYSKARQSQGDMAVWRVIDYFNNPEKYKEIITMQRELLFFQG